MQQNKEEEEEGERGPEMQFGEESVTALNFFYDKLNTKRGYRIVRERVVLHSVREKRKRNEQEKTNE
jgi:hypothetical protein